MTNESNKVSYYNHNTGELTNREKEAKKRLDALIAQYRSSGMSEAEARERAIEVMRDNPRMDWRGG
jgi:predicted aconitase